MIRELDDKIPTFCDYQEASTIFVLWLLGVLPYMVVEADSIPFPFLTGEMYEMKMKEYKAKNSIKAYVLGCMFLIFVKVTNFSINSMLDHLNRRGCLTCYWVLNDDREIEWVMNNTSVNGIMTDRPAHLKAKYLSSNANK